MSTFVILSKLAPDAFREPDELRQVAERVADKIKSECPKVNWKDSYACMGRFDVVDVVEADNPADVEKAAMLIRAHGHAETETMHATPWKEFLSGL